uniref:Uncharacterized protein n=1 Tax=Anguilla anguilla TaxID=7936 RepID=A0A0E9U2G4_ANGAN
MYIFMKMCTVMWKNLITYTLLCVYFNYIFPILVRNAFLWLFRQNVQKSDGCIIFINSDNSPGPIF